ncbi:MAG: gliding motility lipoprotein GldD [Bacteroidales bacterium]|nr:gliding motility lipoprotein GldD [Bacteroidales bacterium]
MLKPGILTYINVIAISILIFLSGCNKKNTPKPRGFFRIDLHEKQYKRLDENFPFSFNYPVYTVINKDKSKSSENYWFNIEYPDINGKIHISYIKIDENLDEIIEDTRKLAYKHTVKAEAINERVFFRPENDVYGILYEIEGNAASSMQFFLTDSINHYLRGALYFNCEPDKDSLAPVIKFVKEDIVILMESLEWE